MAIDVTDATFQTDVIDQSATAVVVVDLWAPWCGPCKTLGPILEKAIDETNGRVVLAKVNIDENPGISQAFKVQSIPAVFAFAAGQVVDGFVGAIGDREARAFIDRLLPSEQDDLLAELIARGDEASLRAALEIEPGNEEAILVLAELLVEAGDGEGALALLARIPESDRTRRVAAMARVGIVPDDDHDATLTALLDQVKTDDAARQQYVDILELMGPLDPRTAAYRKLLTARLF
jgi:putative thioredoxin